VIFQGRLQFYFCKQKNSQYREHEEEQKEESSDVRNGWHSDDQCVEDDLHSLRLLNEFKDAGHAKGSDESGRGATVYIHCQGDDGGDYRRHHDHEVENIACFAEVGAETKSCQF